MESASKAGFLIRRTALELDRMPLAIDDLLWSFVDGKRGFALAKATQAIFLDY